MKIDLKFNANAEILGHTLPIEAVIDTWSVPDTYAPFVTFADGFIGSSQTASGKLDFLVSGTDLKLVLTGTATIGATIIPISTTILDHQIPAWVASAIRFAEGLTSSGGIDVTGSLSVVAA